ncbi:hypothetical protein [Streptomyces sp. NPDC020298]|uniref:hypothetical protein n=1 Tax=unclassified Streptomyces TaxID=2593676 RepID=UPI0033F6222E
MTDSELIVDLRGRLIETLDDFFELNFLLPLVLGAEALVGLMARTIGRRLVLHAPRAVRVSLSTLLVVVTTVRLA